MGEILQKLVAAVYFLLAALVIAYPHETRAYINTRLEGIALYVPKYARMMSIYPGNVLRVVPDLGIYAMGGLLLLGGVFVVSKMNKVICVYALLSLMIGTLLHFPYRKGAIAEYPTGQCRKLVFTVAFYLCQMIVISGRVFATRPKRAGATMTVTAKTPAGKLVPDGTKVPEEKAKGKGKHKKE